MLSHTGRLGRSLSVLVVARMGTHLAGIDWVVEHKNDNGLNIRVLDLSLVLSRDPSLTPDQVKYLFMAEAVDLKDTPSHLDGNGKIQPKDAAKAPVQNWAPALSGSSSGMTAPSGTSWSGGTWSGTSWSGGAWSGTSWSGTSWSGTSWSGTSWSGAFWSTFGWS